MLETRWTPIRTLESKLPLRVRPAVPLSDDELFELCGRNPELRIERTAEGDLILMTPAGTATGRRNFEITTQLGIWAQRDGSGVCFDSSAGFILPNGAERSPDASWLRLERWKALTPQQQERFAPVCPDFVVELLSPSDDVAQVRAKMEEYRANGAMLGWLIHPFERRVEVYRPGAPVETLLAPSTVSGDPLLAGFVLELARIWA